MKLSALLMTCLCGAAQLLIADTTSAQKMETKTITLELRNEQLGKALDKIEQLSGLRIAYPPEQVARFKTINLEKGTRSVQKTLELVLYNTGLVFRQVNNNIIISAKRNTPAPLLAETPAGPVDTLITVKGKVTSSDGTPLAGATIQVSGTTIGAIAAPNGSFELRRVPPNAILLLSYQGQTTEYVLKGRQAIAVVFPINMGKTLDSVTVVYTGYQSLPKERATGSFSVITAKDLARIPTANLIQRLEGLVTGVQPSLNAGDNSFLYSGLVQGLSSPTHTVGNNDYNINVRGNTTLQGEKFPLLVVDGFPTEFDIKSLNPADIEQVTFLKDAAAASIWGARAANGVIVVETKKGRVQRAPSVNFSTSYTGYAKPRFNYLPLLNSAQQINVDQEVANKALFLYNPLTAAASNKYPVSDGVDLTLRLKAGLIDSATYKAAIAQLSNTNGYDQLQQYLLQHASSQQYDLSVSGGNDYHAYFFSTSYARELPNAVGTKGDRFTLTANQEFKLFKKATLATSFKAAFFNYSNNGLGVTPVGVNSVAYLPYNQIVDAAGNKKYYNYAYYSGRTDTLRNRGYLPWGYNFADELTNSNNTTKDNNYSGTINLNIPVYKGLAVSGQFMIEKFYQSVRVLYGDSSFYVRNTVNAATSVNYTNGARTYGIPLGNIMQQTFSNNTNYSARAQAIYNATVKGIHQINAVAGAEIRQTQASQTTPPILYGYNTQTGIAQPLLTSYTDVNGFTNTTTSYNTGGQGDRTRRFLSYYANGAYTLLGKYTLSASVRYDDYNNFGVERKYRATPLWSTGLKWNLLKESFMDKTGWLNALSLRATYGYNGNLSLSNTAPFTVISLSTFNNVTGLPNASISSPANPELRWERTGIFNIGVDYALLNNRLSGSVEGYWKYGRDLLYSFPIDPTYGVGSSASSSNLYRNTAQVNAKGFETTLSGAVVQNKDWSWNATLTFSYNKSVVADMRFAPTSTTYNSPYATNYIKGYPTDALFAFKFAGLDNTNGLALIYDDKGNKVASNVNLTSFGGIKYMGKTTAPYYGGFSHTVRYKQLSLFALATYSFGNVFYRPTVSSYPAKNTIVPKYDLHEDMDKRWRQPGDEATTNVPAMFGTINGINYASTSLVRYRYSDINVLPGDYIRLREVSLSYLLPAALAARIHAQGLSLSGTARNLGLLWTKNREGIDPDFQPVLSPTQLRLPPSVSYTLTLSANF